MVRRPLVSIIVPSFNQGRYIDEMLSSCLEQDYEALEVVVVDGGSTDETLEVLRRKVHPKVRWSSEPDHGVADAVNKGLERARGEILTIQSSDDVFLPGAVSAAVEAFQEHPEAGIVYGDVDHLDAESKIIGRDVQGPFDMAEYLGRYQYIPQAGAFFTRSAVGARGWRAKHAYTADADFWIRIALSHRVVKLDRKMAQYRYHDQQRDRNAAAIAADWDGMIRDLLQAQITDSRQRRYARMGVHLAWYRYTPQRAWLKRTYHLYRAALTNPAALVDKQFPKRDLLPGRAPIWSLLSQLKRGLGLTPRSA